MLLRHFGYGAYGPARRGKRLRPQMVLRVAVAEGAPIERALDAAVAVEIFHNYSLVHDDIEDRDELRHGRRTLWSEYGVGAAINAGDAMCALSFLSLEHAGTRLDAARVLQMLAVLHDAHAVMCEGQSLDLYFESAKRVDLPGYYRMIACKTAQLFDASCRLGAYAAGCDAAAIRVTATSDARTAWHFKFATTLRAFGRRSTRRAKPPPATSRVVSGPFPWCGRSRNRRRLRATPSNTRTPKTAPWTRRPSRP